MLSVVRRLCGQPSMGPIGWRDQSIVRMSAPVSPLSHACEPDFGSVGVAKVLDGGVLIIRTETNHCKRLTYSSIQAGGSAGKARRIQRSARRLRKVRE